MVQGYCMVLREVVSYERGTPVQLIVAERISLALGPAASGSYGGGVSYARGYPVQLILAGRISLGLGPARACCRGERRQRGARSRRRSRRTSSSFPHLISKHH